MAGSFEVFRKYQRSLLVFVAILAMLAFFVLPPILDALQSSGAGAANPVVATWKGGAIRERELARALQVRRFINGQLGVRLTGDDEASVVRDLVLAGEAEAAGIVVDNDAVDRFLKSSTGIRAKDLELLIAQGLQQRPSVSETDVFDALRTRLAAARLMDMFAEGLNSAPPAARWDAFRKLEQAATVEVVPVVVESLVGDVPKPSEAEVRDLFDRAKDRLPDDRSPEPGFKQPQRISYEWLVADMKKREAEAAEKVTDEEIKNFYEQNKKRLYVAEPGGAATDATSGPAAAGSPPATGSESPAATPEEPTDAEKPTAPADKPADDDPKPADAGGTPAPAPAEPQSAAPGRTQVMSVKFRQPESADGAGGQPPSDAPAAGPDVPSAADREEDASTYKPLDEVRDDIRRQIISIQLQETFKAVKNDVTVFARDLSKWRSRKGTDADKPVPPNVETIGKIQGLGAGRAERRTKDEAFRDGGLGESFFPMVVDRRSPTGIRQDAWADLMFKSDWPLWDPRETFDEAGNRYLSWKTEDVPEIVPEFDAVQGDVERAWRTLAARPRAEALAKEIAAGASGGKTLADVVAGREGPQAEAVQIEPFTWLVSFRQVAPTLSQPKGLEMPGEDFMRAVFALEPGGTTVAFNEPRTVCYVIRLVSYTSTEDDLRRRFLEPRDDDRKRIDAVILTEGQRVFNAWLADVGRRAEIDWKRPPRRPEQ